MHNILVIQSHRTPLPYLWIQACINSVQDWCNTNGYKYQFIDDRLFELLPDEIVWKTRHQKVIATDLARILLIKKSLNDGYKRVIWLDSDFMIFNPAEFIIPDLSYAVGREVWVQKDKHDNLKVYKKVHNAFLMFSENNSFLDFYIETALRLLMNNQGTMPPQFIGPKLLTALHNVACLPVMEGAGMLSPLVVKDIIAGGGVALDLFKQHSNEKITGANLCISSCHRQEIFEKEMDNLVSILPSVNLTV